MKEKIFICNKNTKEKIFEFQKLLDERKGIYTIG